MPPESLPHQARGPMRGPIAESTPSSLHFAKTKRSLGLPKILLSLSRDAACGLAALPDQRALAPGGFIPVPNRAWTITSWAWSGKQLIVGAMLRSTGVCYHVPTGNTRIKGVSLRKLHELAGGDLHATDARHLVAITWLPTSNGRAASMAWRQSH